MSQLKRNIGSFLYIFLLFFTVYFLAFVFILLLYIPFLRWIKTDAVYALPGISELYLYGKAVGVLTLISSIGLWFYQKILSRR